MGINFFNLHLQPDSAKEETSSKGGVHCNGREGTTTEIERVEFINKRR